MGIHKIAPNVPLTQIRNYAVKKSNESMKKLTTISNEIKRINRQTQIIKETGKPFNVQRPDFYMKKLNII